MKSVKEIREEAKMLYTKSSHYIVATFISVGTLMTFVQTLFGVLGKSFSIPYLFLASVIFAPMQYGTVKACLLAYDHEAKQVKTVPYTLMGFTKYFKAFMPFVGRAALIYAVQAVLVIAFCYLSGQVAISSVCLEAALTGDFALLVNPNGSFIVTTGTVFIIIASIIVGFLLEAYFSLSYFYAIEYNQGLVQSLKSSYQHLKGFLWDYIWLRITYLPYAIATAVVAGVVTKGFTTMFQQMISIIPNVPILLFNILLIAIVSFVNSLVSVMIYKVKEDLALTILYKELDSVEE